MEASGVAVIGEVRLGYTMRGAGHLLHLEQPERFARALLSFLALHPIPASVLAPQLRR